MSNLIFDNVSFSYSAAPLLDRITFEVGGRERACIIGPNGCGKTTLLRIATGELTPDHGSVTRTGADGILRSVPKAEGFVGSVAEFLNDAVGPLRELSSRFSAVAAEIGSHGNTSDLAQKYDKLLTDMITYNVWSLEAQIEETLAGLKLSGLNGEGRGRSLSSLSPGQRGRLQLAATLIMRPTALILDEPTNHLDAEAIDYLTRIVCSWDGPVLMASHDRAFIERTATAVYDMDITVWRELARAESRKETYGLVRCAGNYSDYMDAKAKARIRQRELHSAQQADKNTLREHRRISSTIARGGVRLATAEGTAKKFFADRASSTALRRTRNDDRRLEALAEHEVRKPREFDLSFPSGAARGGAGADAHAGLAVIARNAQVRGRLAPQSFDLARSEHLLVTGANGAGKTTLLNWIAGGRPPAQARGTISSDASAGMVPQRLPLAGDPGISDTIWHNGIGALSTGIVHPAMWAIPVAALSAGNQRRVQIAVALAGNPGMLIIDEPTNYLDLDTLQALEQALDEWKGTLIVSSHDRWLIDHWSGRKLHLTAPGAEAESA